MRGKKPQITHIYGLFDPRTSECFYVGKANDLAKRLAQHKACTKNQQKHDRIRSIEIEGHQVEMRLLETVPYGDWESAEIAWIRHLLEAGQPLTNQTPGGTMPRAVSIEETHRLADTMSSKIERFEALLTHAFSRPVPEKYKRFCLFREASFDALKVLTRHLMQSKDIAAKTKAAIIMNDRMQWLEQRYGNQI